MERGRLALNNRPTTVFVFEDLIAFCDRRRSERSALRLHQWAFALDLWTFDLQVCDYMIRLIDQFQVPVEVITWRAEGFAEVLHNKLWSLSIYVRSTSSAIYSSLSPRYAIDPEINVVYDADPTHNWGYGFKCREFDAGTYV